MCSLDKQNVDRLTEMAGELMASRLLLLRTATLLEVILDIVGACETTVLHAVHPLRFRAKKIEELLDCPTLSQ